MNDLAADAPVRDIAAYMADVGERARAAARVLARAGTEAKDRALTATAAALRRSSAALLAANQIDVTAARAAGHDAAFVDRLTLGPKGIEAMAQGVEAIV